MFAFTLSCSVKCVLCVSVCVCNLNMWLIFWSNMINATGFNHSDSMCSRIADNSQFEHFEFGNFENGWESNVAIEIERAANQKIRWKNRVSPETANKRNSRQKCVEHMLCFCDWSREKKICFNIEITRTLFWPYTVISIVYASIYISMSVERLTKWIRMLAQKKKTECALIL